MAADYLRHDRILELFRASLNVTGDLVACTVMDRRVTLPEPKEKEILREEKIQQIREFTGEDTVVQQVSSS